MVWFINDKEKCINGVPAHIRLWKRLTKEEKFAEQMFYIRLIDCANEGQQKFIRKIGEFLL